MGMKMSKKTLNMNESQSPPSYDDSQTLVAKPSVENSQTLVAKPSVENLVNQELQGKLNKIEFAYTKSDLLKHIQLKKEESLAKYIEVYNEKILDILSSIKRYIVEYADKGSKSCCLHWVITSINKEVPPEYRNIDNLDVIVNMVKNNITESFSGFTITFEEYDLEKNDVKLVFTIIWS